tara:strand:- start:1416 stop:1736 length:321 start_codon:yes stop_codon:yes gene_type:complete
MWQEILKSSVLEKVDSKKRKRLKKLLQASQPSEFFGQDMTKLSSLLDEFKSLDMKKDERLQKKIEVFEEKNLEILASAAEVRKDYEVLYEQMRKLIYPKQKKVEKK